MMRGHVEKNMIKMGVAVNNAYIRTIMDISRKPRIHSLVIIAIPPMMTWTCDDSRDVCDLYLLNLEEELESLGLMGIVQIRGNQYHMDIYEKMRL